MPQQQEHAEAEQGRSGDALAPVAPLWSYAPRRDLRDRGYTDDDKKSWLRKTTDYVTESHKPTFRIHRRLHSWFYNLILPLVQTRGLHALTILKWLLAIAHLFAPLAVVAWGALQRIEGLAEILYFAILYMFVLSAVEWGLKWRERRNERDREQASVKLGMGAWQLARREMQNLLSVTQNETGWEHKQRIAKEQLSIWMLHALDRRIGARFTDLKIKVFVFTDATCKRLRACVSVPPSEEKDPDADLPGSLLSWVARTGVQVDVPSTHYRWHPFDMSPERQEQRKSKILIPLTAEVSGAPAGTTVGDDAIMHVWGVVAVETATPFAFDCVAWKGIEDEISVLTTLLRLCIGIPTFRRRADVL